MKHLLLILTGMLLMTSCNRDNQVTGERPKLIDLTIPFNVVHTGHVGEIPRTASGQPDSEKQIKFDRIRQGECAAVAYSSFGRPIYQGSDMPMDLELKTIFSDTGEFKQYVVWQNRSVFYCLGFNELGTLVSKHIGTR